MARKPTAVMESVDAGDTVDGTSAAPVTAAAAPVADDISPFVTSQQTVPLDVLNKRFQEVDDARKTRVQRASEEAQKAVKRAVEAFVE